MSQVLPSAWSQTIGPDAHFLFNHIRLALAGSALLLQPLYRERRGCPKHMALNM